MLLHEMKDMCKQGDIEAIKQLMLVLEETYKDGKNRKFNLKPRYRDNLWDIELKYGKDGVCYGQSYTFKMDLILAAEWCKNLMDLNNIEVQSYYNRMINAIESKQEILALDLANLISGKIFSATNTKPYDRIINVLSFILRQPMKQLTEI